MAATHAPEADPQPSPKTLNITKLSHDEVLQLLEHAMQRDPNLTQIVQEAITRAEAKPPPSVDYKSLRSNFNYSLHSLDSLRTSQQYEQLHIICWEIHPMIEQVKDSVNQNSPRETIEEAFLCLQKFAGQVTHADSYIHDQLTDNGGTTMDDICAAMKTVGALLRAKGGSTDVEIKEKIIEYKKEYRYTKFEDVLKTVWGENWEADDDESEEEEEEEEEIHPKKRARY
jgi:hypothetical protein